MRSWVVLLSACGRVDFAPVPIDAPADAATAALVQTAGKQQHSASQDVAFPAPTTAGDLVVVVVGSLTPVAALTDDAGNAYTQEIGYVNTDDGSDGYLYWSVAAQPATTLTVAFATNDTHTAYAFEYRGYGAAVATASGHGASGTALASGPLAADAGALLVAFTHQPKATKWTASDGWTVRADNMDTFVIDAVAPTAGSYDAMLVASKDQPWDAHLVAFAPP